MTQWYVKELSEMTSVSVQTLHHYDRISLLKPSIRLPNGYRVYSEKDLLKLQQIIALKYFGFKLSQIKMLLSGSVEVMDHLSIQSQLLETKANMLLEASANLKRILLSCDDNKSVPWETIIKLIEVYRMVQQLEKSWEGKVFSAEELKKYAHFEQEWQARFSEKEKQQFSKEWTEIVSDIDVHLKKDPSSQIGIEIGKRCMHWVNKVYGKENASLRTAIWEKGFMQGHGHDEHGLTMDAAKWLDKAIFAYHTSLIKDAVSQIEKAPSSSSAFNSWENVLTEICGTDGQLRKELIGDILKNEKISVTVKEWIKKTSQ